MKQNFPPIYDFFQGSQDLRLCLDLIKLSNAKRAQFISVASEIKIQIIFHKNHCLCTASQTFIKSYEENKLTNLILILFSSAQIKFEQNEFAQQRANAKKDERTDIKMGFILREDFNDFS